MISIHWSPAGVPRRSQGLDLFDGQTIDDRDKPLEEDESLDRETRGGKLVLLKLLEHTIY